MEEKTTTRREKYEQSLDNQNEEVSRKNKIKIIILIKIAKENIINIRYKFRNSKKKRNNE